MKELEKLKYIFKKKGDHYGGLQARIEKLKDKYRIFIYQKLEKELGPKE